MTVLCPLTCDCRPDGPSHWQRLALRHQRGVTLVELMVAIALNLVLVLAATLLYINTRGTQKAVDERGAMSEAGQFALELLGREIALAGFYPVTGTEPVSAGQGFQTSVRMSFDRAAAQMVVAGATKVASYQGGVFGCAGQTLTESHACALHTSTTGTAAGSDAFAVAYFTSDAMSMAAGQRADCTRADVANDATLTRNTTRLGTVPGTGTPANATTGAAATPDKSRTEAGLPPASPLMVINQYFLGASSFTGDSGNKINTFALKCRGNGRNAKFGDDIELVPGVEQMVLSYGLKDLSSGAPVRYVSATDVSALQPVQDGDQTLTGWQQVVSVRMCLLVRSLSNNTAVRNAAGEALNVTDCRGNAVSRTDGAQVRTFERVFSVKNRQGNTVGPASGGSTTPTPTPTTTTSADTAGAV
ncbi:PilW family protein [uncultured Aquabacterium sp.]|uniref:PilW family protein n=1 Tax=uncultured Aquabacterium sp. TaxID=158753 RepID=UPI0030CACC7E